MIVGIPVFIDARSVFYREKASKMYEPIAYATAFALTELPYIFCQTLVFVIPVNQWIDGLVDVEHICIGMCHCYSTREGRGGGSSIFYFPFVLSSLPLLSRPKFYFIIGLNENITAFLWFFFTVFVFGALGTFWGEADRTVQK
jgi:hypothetical protein